MIGDLAKLGEIFFQENPTRIELSIRETNTFKRVHLIADSFARLFENQIKLNIQCFTTLVQPSPRGISKNRKSLSLPACSPLSRKEFQKLLAFIPEDLSIITAEYRQVRNHRRGLRLLHVALRPHQQDAIQNEKLLLELRKIISQSMDAPVWLEINYGSHDAKNLLQGRRTTFIERKKPTSVAIAERVLRKRTQSTTVEIADLSIKDMRSIHFFTIDPEACIAADDAIALHHGELLIAFAATDHIASPGTDLFEQAHHRQQASQALFPEDLYISTLSLNQANTNEAWVVCIPVDEPKNYRIERAIIHPRSKHTYEEANDAMQNRISRVSHITTVTKSIANELEVLGIPNITNSHQLIYTLMKIGKQVIGQYCEDRKQPMIYRRPSKCGRQEINRIVKLLKEHGIATSCSDFMNTDRFAYIFTRAARTLPTRDYALMRATLLGETHVTPHPPTRAKLRGSTLCEIKGLRKTVGLLNQYLLRHAAQPCSDSTEILAERSCNDINRAMQSMRRRKEANWFFRQLDRLIKQQPRLKANVLTTGNHYSVLSIPSLSHLGINHITHIPNLPPGTIIYVRPRGYITNSRTLVCHDATPQGPSLPISSSPQSA